MYSYEFKIDEQAVIDWGRASLPMAQGHTHDIAVVAVPDFIGQHAVCEKLSTSFDSFGDLGIVNGKRLLVDYKPESFYYYVVFSKAFTNRGIEWDLVGFDKRPIYRNGPSIIEQSNAKPE